MENSFVLKQIHENGLNPTVELLQKQTPTVKSTTLYTNLDRLNKKYSRLLKDQNRVKGKINLETFLEKKYEYPKPSTNSTSTSTSVLQPFDVEHDNPVLASLAYKTTAEKLGQELNSTIEENRNTKESLGVLENQNVELNKNLQQTKLKLNEQRKSVKRASTREGYWREKCRKVEETVCANPENDNDNNFLDQLVDENDENKNKIKELNEIIDDLKTENDMLKKIENVELYNTNKKEYLPELHTCVYALLDNHVTTEHVSPVIEAALMLVNKKANKLPSKSTINNWSIERSLLSRKHMSTIADNENTTLHTDEASKYGNKWGAFANRDGDGNYHLLGLRDMATKSSSDTLDTFKDILEDIDRASESDDSGKKILINIKNTMSDRAATETKFNKMLKEYREEILPQVFERYNVLNEEAQIALSRMNNFFCGLHSLVHMAETCQKSINEVEKAHFDNEIPVFNPSFNRNGQTGTVRLIFTACKAFARRGDPKSGCHGNFSTFIKPYLKDNGFLSFPLQPLRGNRFNILFVNAGHIYFFKEKMIEFLDKTSSSNGLLQSVKQDLNEPFFIAGCKALGLISKLITTPLWNVIENKRITIYDMAERYLDLKLFLQQCLHELEPFIKGELILYNDVPVKKDQIYEKLTEPSDFDNHVVTLLGVIIPALTKLIEKEFSQHLPGGEFENVDQQSTVSVDKHNKFPERVFSYVDHILAAKPNITTIALESQITFSLNKTNEWLCNKNKEEMNKIIIECRKEVKKERALFKERERDIRSKRLEKQRIDFEKKAALELKRIKKLELETSEMQYYGLWQSEIQVDNELKLIKSRKEKEEALKAQLRFRKNVFQQKHDENVYLFSRDKISLTVEELTVNVKKLVLNAFTPSLETSSSKTSLLVGKRVKQKFKDSESGNFSWYRGKVISQVPGFPKWYNIIFDNDQAIYSDTLDEHYRRGDLEILVDEDSTQA